MDRTVSSRAGRRALLVAVVVAAPALTAEAALLSYSTAAIGVQNWNNGAFWVGTPANSTAHPDVAAEDVEVNSSLAQINVNANYTIGKLDFGAGAISGTFDLTTAGRFTWTGGTLGGSGAVNANSGFDITGSAARVLNGRSVYTFGSVNWSSGSIRVDSNTTIGNNSAAGVFNLGAVSVDPTSVGTLTLFNGGTLRYNVAASTTLARTNIENGKLLAVDQGSLGILGGVNFDDITLAGGSTLTLGGAFRLHGGPNPSDSVITGASSAASHLATAAGATLTVSNNVASSAFETLLKDVSLDNAGTILVPGDDVLSTTGTGVIHNTGTIAFAGSGGLNTAVVRPTGPGTGVINDGTLRLTSTAGTVTAYMPISQSALGAMELLAGTLDLRGATNLAGTVDINAGATLQLANQTSLATITAAATVDGILTTNAGTAFFDTSASLSGSGTLIAKGIDATRVGSIQVNGASVTGALDVDVQNFGAVVFATTATLGDLDIAGFGEFGAGQGVTAGSVQSFGVLTVSLGGSLTATSIDLSGQTIVSGSLASQSTFTNTGQLTVNVLGSLAADAGFDNQGDLALATGTPSVVAVSATSLTNSGTIYGDGTLDVPLLQSAGALAPGTSSDVGIGTISVTGDLSLDVFHFLKVEVDATTLAADKVVANGDVTLDGLLDFVHIIGDASSLLAGQQFTILQGSTLAGDFNPLLFNGDRIDAFDDVSNTGSFKVVVDQANARVYLTDFALVPEPTSMVALGLLGAILGRRLKQ